MSDLIFESADQGITAGKKIKLNTGATKQIFKHNNKTYVSVFCDVVEKQKNELESLIEALAKEIEKFLKPYKNILVVGLGNRHIEADSLGVESLKYVISTRNISNTFKSVSAISTGVFGLTGIESSDVVKAVSKAINCDAVVVIDTLCANNYESLAKNIQISDYGFDPGAGVGNKRKRVGAKELNRFVLSIGVPFVVYAKSFVESAVNYCISSTMQNAKNTPNLGVFNKMLELDFNNLVLTTSNAKKQVNLFAYVIGSAINLATNKFSLTEQNIILNA